MPNLIADTDVPTFVIQNIPADPSGLTQPWATLGTGVLAVVAAVIAYLGVRHAQNVAVRNTKAQLRQQAVVSLRQQKQHQAQLDAQAEIERSKHRREKTFDAMSETVESLIELRSAFIALNDEISSARPLPGVIVGGNDDEIMRLTEVRARCTATAAMLLLLDMDAQYQSVIAVNNFVGTILTDKPGEPLGLPEVQQFATLWTTAIGDLRGKYATI
ncbi:hypothetical protein ACWEQD_12265 [Rhodococcus pyridinivorans]